MAVSAIVAITGAEAASVVAIMTTIAEVGSVMSLVGVVTGNKDLMKIGGIVGGVAGLSNLAYSTVGAGASTASGFASGATVASEADIASQGALDVGSQSVTDAATTSPVMQSTVTPTPLEPAQSQAPMPTTDVAKPVANTEPTTAAPGVDTSGTTGAAATKNPYDTGISDPATVGTPYDPSNATRLADYKTSGNSVTSTIKDFWDGLGERGKSTVIGAGMSMFSGAQNAEQAAQKNAIDQQRVNQTSYGSAIPVGILAQRKV